MARPSKSALIGALLVLAFAAIATFVVVRIRSAREFAPSAAVTPAVDPVEPQIRDRFVGAASCRQCHDREFQAWTGSHHQLAMLSADASTVLGNFDSASFEHFGVKSTFSKHDGKYFVRTDGPSGALTDYEVKYTFGVTPLQQYLIEFPGGRLQALGIAWDSRPKANGGQRWFHLYANEKIDHTDQLHWTGRYQNWNMMCAECHSTNLRKGYDAASNAYRTTYNEINVSCEACHGAGSRHVDWARQPKKSYPRDGDQNQGLSVRLESGWATAWNTPAPDARFPVRTKLANPAAANACAACHARRSTLVEGGTPGAPLGDTHRLAMLTDPLYHADGQQRDEVYTWGSFLQSRMFQKGVTCADCHEPHSLKIRFEGNNLCARCHNPTIFDTPKHHFHPADSKGAACVSCHMPTQKYMVVHDRLDHSLRVPRPDLSESIGTPNACTMCHNDRKPAWASAAMDDWYGATWRQRPTWGPALHAGATQGARALPALLDLARDETMPGIVRATAAAAAQPLVRPDALSAIQALLKDSDPLVRAAAVGMLETFEVETRFSAGAPLLSDPIRAVRIEAARILADLADTRFTPDRLAARQQALTECLESLRLNADWPAENVNRGNLALRQGRPDDAIVAYERAIAQDPRFVGAYINLADALRRRARDESESDGEAVLRRGLAASPDAADLHYSLGLLLVRKHDSAGALVELHQAATLAPRNARFTYVYAIALNSASRVDEALEALRAADLRNPGEPDFLRALVSIHLERNGPGDAAAALVYARKLAELSPGNPQIRQLIERLEKSK